MAQPFTPEQRDAIRARLIESARAHALSPGMKKTSLDALTGDAGISKSSFYRFFDSKEALFLEIAVRWEKDVIAAAHAALDGARGQSDKQRAAAMVYAAFEAIHNMGIIDFLCEDLPDIMSALSDDDVRNHYRASAQSIFAMLHEARIRFTVPDDVVISAIQIMYLSILHTGQIGEPFFRALRVLVIGACDKLVAAANP